MLKNLISSISSILSKNNTEEHNNKKISYKRKISPKKKSVKNINNRGRSKVIKNLPYVSMPDTNFTYSYEKLLKIINKTKLNITDRNFINKDSKFIVITYWWGRGNINFNTQLPCKNLHYLKYNWILKDGQKLIQDPVYFEKMINQWENICSKNNCNFFSQEYPEFAEPGGYQLAINAKPLFIKKVLDTLTEIGRDDIAVVYIDGDMTVNKYPSIFDMKNIDFMSRGWNMDPRGGYEYLDYPMFDPFTFETSGGIMYFANNIFGRKILDLWIDWSSKKKFDGKADDRILSMLISAKQLYIDCNILQLPIEYLWLTQAYEPTKKSEMFLDKKHFNRSHIYIEHPACLTLEEVARDQGASSNREPDNYANIVNADQIEQSEGGLLYEYIIFDNYKNSQEWKYYLDYMKYTTFKDSNNEELAMYHIVKYNNVYGELNKFFEDNTNNIQLIMNNIRKDIDKYENIYIEINNQNKITNNKILLNNPDDLTIINYIIAVLCLQKNVIYNPNINNNISLLGKIGRKYKEYEFIANVDTYERLHMLSYITKNSILYFNHSSDKLIKILRISKNIDDFINNFRKCALYIQLVRCLFILNQSSNKNSLKSKKPKSLENIKTKYLITSTEKKSITKIYSKSKSIKNTILK
jgi:hypothetical protein